MKYYFTNRNFIRSGDAIQKIIDNYGLNNAILFMKDDWDDMGYKTTFDIQIIKNKLLFNNSRIKIGVSDAKNTFDFLEENNLIDKPLEKLDNKLFSLGEIEYYKKQESIFGRNIANKIYKDTNDVSLKENITLYDKIKSLNVFKDSLLRENNVKAIKNYVNRSREIPKFLENLKKNNQFPIIFIGSGITKRYFSNSPSWDDLLKKLWDLTYKDSINVPGYFAKYNELSNKHKNNFKVFTELADLMKKDFDNKFLDGNIEIQNLTPEKSHNEHISPFKSKISEIFNNLTELKNDFYEISLFKKMLEKARLIITTNYDSFIEDSLDKKVDVKIGNKGLFHESNNFGELYKIHGSVEDPNSIVITKADYKKQERTSAILDAKILNSLVTSPIIFFGYSLNDENILRLLMDISDNMPENVDAIANRIAVVKHNKDYKYDIKESITNQDKSINGNPYHAIYTKLETDNFEDIYREISEVDQGIKPKEISRYQNAFKQIIEIKGREGNLDKVLTSFVDLENLPETIQNKNLVVAFGDKQYIYMYPNYVDYIKNYFNKADIPAKIALEFIAKYSPSSPLPISKYLPSIKKEHITEKKKQKLNSRINKFSTISSLEKNIPSISNEMKSKLDKINLDDNDSYIEILDSSDIDDKSKVIYILNNQDKFELNKVVKYILKNKNDDFIKMTESRKLMMLCSLENDPKCTAL